ncbi:hypothetical protein EFS18_10595 [Levilactobacillus brevis]|nr:hypothetical protein [Levilactobacillus brevis]
MISPQLDLLNPIIQLKGMIHMKKLINVLWAIEKDLHVIASNTEAHKNGNSSVTITPKGTIVRSKRINY